MLFKEVDDCGQCPLLNEFCKGGWTSSPSGNPIEPPCTSFNPDDDLDELYDKFVASQMRYEENLDRKWKKEETERKVKEEKGKRASEARSLTYSESRQITRLRRKIRNNNKFLGFTRSFASAINMTNEMFRYEERIVEKPKNPLEIENEKLQAKIDELDKVRKEKLKQLRDKRKAQQ